MIVVHRIARQMSRIAERRVSLFGHTVTALRRFADNVRRNDIPMVQRCLQSVLGVRKDLLDCKKNTETQSDINNTNC